MAKDPPRADDGWDETRETIDGFVAAEQSFYPGRYPAGYDYPIRYEGPTPESFQQSELGLSSYETISLVRDAVASAQENMQQPLAGSELVEGAVNLKLTIDLSDKKIGNLPPEVVNIIKRDVERLILSHNQIWHVPYDFAKCTALTYLNLKGNRFKQFPKAVLKLSQLEILDLSHNRLTSIPEDIKNMKALSYLSLMHNSLGMIPFSLGSLDSLRLIKLIGNPLIEGLKRIVDGNDEEFSPLATPITDKEKEKALTKKIKEFLKAEAASLESGGESSSEGPLDTPRPLKRNPSLRFPVVPSASGSESASDIRSPGFSNHSISTRSHYRVASGQNAMLQKAHLRRPGLAPLAVGNERNRSNSESILQATQNSKSKRMGIISRKNPDLGTVEEKHANRNSHHYRGQSHASVLPEKYNNGARNGGSGLSVPTSPVNGHVPKIVRRYHGRLLKRKTRSRAPEVVIDGLRDILYTIRQVHPQISALIDALGNRSPEQSSLDRSHHKASKRLERLNKTLRSGENILKHKKKYRHSTNHLLCICKSCVQAYERVVTLLVERIPYLSTSCATRYMRTLGLLSYSGVAEGRNSRGPRVSKSKIAERVHNTKRPIPLIQEEHRRVFDRSVTPTQRQPNPVRRLRSETTSRQPQNLNHSNTSSTVPSAVPSYLNGRSRSNSRTTPLNSSPGSSTANTPRSGESFTIPGVPVNHSRSNTNTISTRRNHEEDGLFERIYVTLSKAVEQGLSALPRVIDQFNNCFNIAKRSNASRAIQELWSRLISKGRFSYELSESLKVRLLLIKLNDAEVRNSGDFWSLCSTFINTFQKFLMGIKEAKQMTLITLELLGTLQPALKLVREAAKYIQASPWQPLFDASPPHGHGRNHSLGQVNGYHRSRGDSGSSSSPYFTSVPATPLSAALGPAAQATVPSTPNSGVSGFDRSFQGDVFQRADHMLSMQQTMIHRR